MADDAEAAGCPLIVQTMYPRSPTSQAFRRRGVPIFADIEAPARALGLILDRLPSPHSVDIPSPHAVGRASGRGAEYFAIRRLLSDAGIRFVEAVPVSTEDQAVAAARELGYPVVLKALGTLHKSDVGGVRLAIANDQALSEAYSDLAARLHPPLLSVERQAPIELGVELLIGVKRDRSFGPIALVGLGGVYAEALRDVAVALAPVSHDAAIRLVRSLRGSQLLTGWRGRPPLDIDAAAAALVSLTAFAASSPQFTEIEINPLLVLPDGAMALDARALSAVP
jgi:acyl-CoA synthetase (NDP forming)